jgi:hypothetical protein
VSRQKKVSWYDYFARKSTSINQIIPEQRTIYLVHSIRLCLLASFKCKLCLREQNKKPNKKLPFTDQGNPQFFYDKPIGAMPQRQFFGGEGGAWYDKGVTLRGLQISEKKEILRKLTVL